MPLLNLLISDIKYMTIVIAVSKYRKCYAVYIIHKFKIYIELKFYLTNFINCVLIFIECTLEIKIFLMKRSFCKRCRVKYLRSSEEYRFFGGK